jgi:hypothetical protein
VTYAHRLAAITPEVCKLLTSTAQHDDSVFFGSSARLADVGMFDELLENGKDTS